MSRTLLLFLLLMVSAMAGCASDDGSDAGGSEADGAGADEVPTTPPLPEWQVGDYWTYDFGGSSVTFVVTEDAGDAWIVDVDDPDSAFNHAYQDEWATIGRIGKSDLAGEEGGSKVEALRWPLEVGTTWSVQWDGYVLDAEIVSASADKARVELRDAGVLFRAYTYDAASQWYSEFTEYLPGGEELYSSRLTDHGSGYTGEYVRYTLHDVIEFNHTVGEPAHYEFTVVPEATDVWFHVYIACRPGGVEGDQGFGGYQIGPRSPEAGMMTSSFPTCPTDREETEVYDPIEGTWDMFFEPFGASFVGSVVVRELQTFALA